MEFVGNDTCVVECSWELRDNKTNTARLLSWIICGAFMAIIGFITLILVFFKQETRKEWFVIAFASIVTVAGILSIPLPVITLVNYSNKKD